MSKFDMEEATKAVLALQTDGLLEGLSVSKQYMLAVETALQSGLGRPINAVERQAMQEVLPQAHYQLVASQAGWAAQARANAALQQQKARGATQRGLEDWVPKCKCGCGLPAGGDGFAAAPQRGESYVDYVKRALYGEPQPAPTPTPKAKELDQGSFYCGSTLEERSKCWCPGCAKLRAPEPVMATKVETPIAPPPPPGTDLRTRGDIKQERDTRSVTLECDVCEAEFHIAFPTVALRDAFLAMDADSYVCGACEDE